MRRLIVHVAAVCRPGFETTIPLRHRRFRHPAMAPKKGGRGGKRSKTNEAALQEQTDAQEKTLAGNQQAEEHPENGQEDAAGRNTSLLCDPE
jgi:hypothetical protein